MDEILAAVRWGSQSVELSKQLRFFKVFAAYENHIPLKEWFDSSFLPVPC